MDVGDLGAPSVTVTYDQIQAYLHRKLVPEEDKVVDEFIALCLMRFKDDRVVEPVFKQLKQRNMEGISTWWETKAFYETGVVYSDLGEFPEVCFSFALNSFLGLLELV